jgi:signal transduction histidine kinase
MSASSHSFPKLPGGPNVLHDLLHSLSQPLTSLRCSLELSLEPSVEEVAERQQESVAVALQQTETVIGMIQLMREYLDAEQQETPSSSSLSLSMFAPVLQSVIEALSSIAVVRGVQLRLVGSCSATLPVPESRLRLALQYLIAAAIETQPMGGKVTLLLGEGPAGAVLRVEGERISIESNFCDPEHGPAMSTLRRVRLAIASRVLEGAGASLIVFGGVGQIGADPVGFVLRIPCRVGVPG